MESSDILAERGNLSALKLMTSYGIWLESLDLRREMSAQKKTVKNISSQYFEQYFDSSGDDERYLSLGLTGTWKIEEAESSLFSERR